MNLIVSLKRKIKEEGTLIDIKNLKGHALREKNEILILIECDTEETAKTAFLELVKNWDSIVVDRGKCHIRDDDCDCNVCIQEIINELQGTFDPGTLEYLKAEEKALEEMDCITLEKRNEKEKRVLNTLNKISDWIEDLKLDFKPELKGVSK